MPFKKPTDGGVPCKYQGMQAMTQIANRLRFASEGK
jgi:hypothetical protein